MNFTMMDKTRIIQVGEEAKFQVDIKDFDMDENDFKVMLSWGYRNNQLEILKSQMLDGGDGSWYFIFDTSQMSGKISAECEWLVPDADCPDGFRTETDLQFLCFVVDVPCPMFISCPNCATDRPVTYTRTEESDVASDYSYLLTSRDDRIMTDNDEFIMVLKTQ